MKIVCLNQYFTTTEGSYGTRIYEFSKRWVKQGHDVTVITSIYYKSDLKPAGLVSDQVFDGVKVKVLNILISNKQSFLKRIWSFVQYIILSSYYVLTLPADVVVASSGPLTVGLPGLVARYLRKRKFVFEVRDLLPEVAVELGVLRNSFMIKSAYWFEESCYRAASLIVTLSPGMSEHIEKKYGLGSLLTIPNAADNDYFGNYNPEWEVPDWVAGRKIAIYTGNIGAVNNSFLLLNAARLLTDKKRDNILILLVGDGQLKDTLKQKAAELNLSNFKILDLMPKRELANWVQRSMCSLVPLRGLAVLDTSSPNKLFDSFAAKVPVVQTTRGWISELLEKEHCGFTVSAEDPADLAEVLIKLANNEKLCREMGLNAKRIALEKFDRSILAQQMLEGLISVYKK